MHFTQFFVTALFAMGSVNAIANPEPEPEQAAAQYGNRCGNDRWSYWDSGRRSCGCRGRRRWDSRRRRCY
ncbi:hypothetical protein CDD80_7256 [Ophiocordyceps camponoti-rufipedis]|uniref:Invertebrate defensins family profile domain-containing protein n=1 Tax=Ophiocordyceps camponoti-rufipedis TaxID=2004952 RepID=A0A2C5ZG44_9HYPO|nr:hypothetical protein CDD80_7256 [Ophiocordyceps camponoti-rufipedis]